MRKKILLGLITALAVVLMTGWYFFFAGTTRFSGSSKFFIFPTGQTNADSILDRLVADSIIGNRTAFNMVAKQHKYWQHVKPGKYSIESGSSVLTIVKMLLQGKQAEVRLVLGKMRQPTELARKMARYIEQDSAAIMQFLTNKDSLAQYGVDADTWMTIIIPNTYHIYWTSTVSNIFRKLNTEQEKWWQKNNRLEKAKQLGFTPKEIYTIASIVEEETNKAKDKPLVASVYINRLKTGMPLQADPTVRFGIKDFTSNRVTYAHLKMPSPYNTYLNTGLPPGPICTPAISTIDSVLNAPATAYLYFVARPDFSGYSVFTTNYADHGKAARVYQDSLTAWLKRKAAKEAAANPTTK